MSIMMTIQTAPTWWISGLCFVALGFFHHPLCGTLDFLRRILSGFIWCGRRGTARDQGGTCGTHLMDTGEIWRVLSNKSFLFLMPWWVYHGLPDSTFFDIISWGFISASSLAAGFFQLPSFKQQRFSPNTVSTLRGSYGGPGLDS